MGFKVHTEAAGSCDHYPNSQDSFSIDGSVLEVVAADGRRIVYGPQGWVRVEVDPPVEGDGRTDERVMRHDSETQGVMRHDT